MICNCFWILTDGRIIVPNSLHVKAVIYFPELFGESEGSILETFQRYGQSVASNVESKAREEVLSRVIKRNHIRIRKNIHKHCQHWSLQSFKLNTERKQAIAKWAKYVSGLTGDRYADVIIHQLHDGSKIKTSLNKLAGRYDGNGEPVVLSQAELTRIYR